MIKLLKVYFPNIFLTNCENLAKTSENSFEH